MKALFVAALALLATSSPSRAAPVVCIDPGHERTPDLSTEPIGPGSSTYKVKDPGGTAGEATVVLQIGRKLRKILVRRGYEVVMTRTTMEFNRGNGGNIARAKFCNRHHAALMVRIHADGSTNRSTHGASTLYPAWHKGWTGDILPQSRQAAAVMQRKYVAKTGAADLGLQRRSDLTGFNWANVPAVLVETGFMTNPTEGARLRTKRYQWKVAHGLANGTSAWLAAP
ncbi:MAG TPA: N-acetylmuramoyl-L-alanine amidase [Gaiellaceae bacterium]